MPTLIQMVNRVRRKARFQDAVTLTGDDMTPAIVDALNEGAREVLESHDWDFDMRHDGVLMTVASSTQSENVSVTNGAVTGGFTVSSFDIDDYATDKVASIVVTSDGSFGDTTFRVPSVTTHATTPAFTVETAWPGTSSAGVGTATIFAQQYLLPDTVRDVTEVRHQERTLHLQFVPREHRFPTRPHQRISTSIETVYVGSTITATYVTNSASAGSTGLGIMLDTVPSSVLRLDYSYRYRHPEMTLTTDTLVGVPDHIQDVIVDTAFAKLSGTVVMNDPDLANVNRITAEANRARIVRQTTGCQLAAGSSSPTIALRDSESPSVVDPRIGRSSIEQVPTFRAQQLPGLERGREPSRPGRQ